MKKNLVNAMLALALLCGWQSAGAHEPRAPRVEVWTAQCHHNPCDDACAEVFLRLSERGYVTVYQITPFGNVEVLYPQPYHCQEELRADRVYRLTELAEEVCWYDEAEGEMQIGVIYTPEPVVLAPWLERSFVQAGLLWGRSGIVYARFDYPSLFARVEADIRIRLGPRCAPVFCVTPVYVRPRVVYRAPHWSHGDRGHWRPQPEYKKREHGRRGYDDDFSRERDGRKTENRAEHRPEPEVRRATFTARPAERKEEPVVAQPSRRERKETAAPNKPDDKDRQRPSSRRSRDTRAEK